MKLKLLIVICILAMAGMACSFTVNLPTLETGKLEQVTVKEIIPTSGNPARVTIEMGAGRLDITGGSPDLVDGTIEFNIPGWKPEINRTGDNLDIIQTVNSRISFPEDKVINTWNLRMGTYPMDLIVKAGAYKGTLDLTGVPITNLEVNDGASQADILFNSPNPVAMNRLVYKTGASQVTLTGLANANTDEIIFEGGTGAYELDFSGTLQQELHVRITAGMSNVKLIFPEDMNVQVAMTGGLSNISPSGTWTIREGVYERTGTTPLIRVDVEMGMGNLQLELK
ncbi:MAG TPA: toast rack family protein [Anaerolineaceae bacterium]|jgi:hypothetical protein|nr:hypothetical protein [Longilinea sp.]NMD31910.1 hypothetical protein [Chloroflexota bacterium]HNS63418.1 toast rack family protein [Anaerolineaceae bacterium]HNY99968.1 toast rack family protein [Anaerolineaceae bacterium]HOH19279.1 toast rack family protein [Anaerolineaceae bacterium]